MANPYSPLSPNQGPLIPPKRAASRYPTGYDGSRESFIEGQLSKVTFSDVNERGRRDGKGEIIRDKKNKAGYGMTRGQAMEVADQQWRAMQPKQDTASPPPVSTPPVAAPAAVPASNPAPAESAKPQTQLVPAGGGGYKEVPVPAKPASPVPSPGLPVPPGSKYPDLYKTVQAAPSPGFRPPLRPPAMPGARPVSNVAANGTYTPPKSVKVDPALWTPGAIAQSQDRSNDPQYQAYRRAQTTNPYSGKPIRGLAPPPMPAVEVSSGPRSRASFQRASSAAESMDEADSFASAPALPTGPAQMNPRQQEGNQLVANTIRGRPLSGSPSLMPSMPKPNLAPPKKPLS